MSEINEIFISLIILSAFCSILLGSYFLFLRVKNEKFRAKTLKEIEVEHKKMRESILKRIENTEEKAVINDLSILDVLISNPKDRRNIN